MQEVGVKRVVGIRDFPSTIGSVIFSTLLFLRIILVLLTAKNSKATSLTVDEDDGMHYAEELVSIIEE